MRNFIQKWGSALALLGILGGLAIAQNITSSVQLSQDPRGAIGVDSNGNVYYQNNVHILSSPNVAAPPVLTACITGGSPTLTGTDFSGTIVSGTTASTSCVVTFGKAFVTAPRCVVTWAAGGPPATTSWTTSTTALTITQASTSSVTINYICVSTS
jgi:hypothetical protein